MWFWIVLISVIVIGFGLMLYSCCVVSGRSDRVDEELLLQNRSTVLSYLEKSSVDKLKEQIEVI